MPEPETKELTGTLQRGFAGEVAAINRIVELAQQATDDRVLLTDDPHYLQIPEGSKIEMLPGAALRPWYQDAPERFTGVSYPGTVQAFIDYVGQFKDNQVTIWVPVTQGKIIAVINDNADQPGWGDFRAELTLTETPEWKHWISANGKDMNQEDFANHIEDGMDEIIEPPAADLLEMAQSIHATNDVRFKSQRRLASGEVQFEYTEEIDATAGTDGKLKIPAEFELAIAPFVGEDPYKVNARLRYRLGQGKLAIGYKLIRPDAVLRDAYQRIADLLMGIERDDDGSALGEANPIFERVYLGTPSASRGIETGDHE